MSTAKFLKIARESLPGGGIWTFSSRPVGFANSLDTPDFLIDRAKGAYVWTTNGDQLLDMVLGSGSVLVGHAHPQLVGAVGAQVALGANYSHLSIPVVKLAARICEIVPCAEKVRFFNSATEAWAIALRTLRALRGRDLILKFEGAFHGGNDSTLFNTNYGDHQNWAEAPVSTPDSPGTARSDAANIIIAPYDDITRTREIANAHKQELAAILFEPIMRGISARPGFIEELRRLANEIHVPLVFDEVITGFRLGLAGAQGYYGVYPDMAIFGKALGSGFPIGVLVGTDEVMSPLDPATRDGIRIIAEGSTLANPVSAIAALTTLEILSCPGTYEHLHDWGTRLFEGLAEVFAQRGILIQCTGVGPIVEFFVSNEPIYNYRAAVNTDLTLKSILARGMYSNRVFGGGGRFNCSLAHGASELDWIIEAVNAILGPARHRSII